MKASMLKRELRQDLPDSRKNRQSIFGLILKGFFMGAADVIPGVSGGTIALIAGIYEELIHTISGYDGQMLSLAFTGNWYKLLKRMNLGFLLPLGFGIITAIFSLARMMTYLLAHHQDLTFAVFFGLILGSAFLMANDFKKSGWTLLFLALGAVFTYGLVGLLPVETPRTLPGISGSFLLLLLGKYKQVMEVVKAPFAEDNFLFVLVFALGALIGIIGFSKLLKWLLQNYHNTLFAFLIGMMLGSLRKLWPFVEVTEILSAATALRLGLMALGFAAVYAIHRVERRRLGGKSVSGI